MLQADLDRLWLPIQYVMPWSESLSGKVSSVLIQEATRSLKSGDVAGCIDHLLEAKRLLNYLARTTARQDGYMDAISWMRIVDQKIHQVVADDQVTTEQLDELANRFPAANRMPPTAVLMMANRQLTWYSLHHQSGPIWERFSAYLKSRKEVIGVVGPDLLRSFVNASWTERKRFLLILDGMTSLLASPENSIQAANEVRRVLSTELDHTFLEYLSSEMGHVATVAFRDTINAEFWAAHNSHRATMLIISAQKHRREHGAFPNRLTDIEEPGLNPTWTVDIRNSNLFSYSPTGFGRDFDILTWYEGANLAMPGAQPILWCSSSPSPSIQKKAPLEDAYSISLEPNRIVYLDTIFGSAYIPASGIATSTEAPVQ